MNMPISKYLAVAAFLLFITLTILFAGISDFLPGEQLGNISFEEKMYTKKDVDDLLALVNGGGGGGDCSCSAKKYPMFMIHLNNTIGWSNEQELKTNYTAFELKASANDFGGDGTNPQAHTEEQKLLYWCGPQLSTTNILMSSKSSLLVFGCNPSGNDPRAWVPIYNKSGNLKSGILPEYIIVIINIANLNPKNWCNSDNEELVWSFLRFSNGTAEKDDNDKPIWCPIQPIKWLNQLPTWIRNYGYVDQFN